MHSYKNIIGANIKKERTSRNMSVDELAKMLNLSATFIGLIERGQRGAKLENLIKISDIFGININDLIYDNPSKIKNEVREPKPENKASVQRTTIASLLYDFDETELEFLIATIRSLRDLRYDKSASNVASANEDTEDEEL